MTTNLLPKKYCLTCDTSKSADDFWSREGVQDGLHSECKACGNARRKRRYRGHRASEIQYHREHYAENAEALKARQRAYNAERREYQRAYAAAQRAANRDAILARRREVTGLKKAGKWSPEMNRRRTVKV